MNDKQTAAPAPSEAPEVKSCPFCGTTPDLFGEGTVGLPFMAGHNKTGCILDGRSFLISVWNTRAVRENSHAQEIPVDVRTVAEAIDDLFDVALQGGRLYSEGFNRGELLQRIAAIISNTRAQVDAGVEAALAELKELFPGRSGEIAFLMDREAARVQISVWTHSMIPDRDYWYGATLSEAMDKARAALSAPEKEK